LCGVLDSLRSLTRNNNALKSSKGDVLQLLNAIQKTNRIIVGNIKIVTILLIYCIENVGGKLFANVMSFSLIFLKLTQKNS
jgi:hypothetical protein